MVKLLGRERSSREVARASRDTARNEGRAVSMPVAQAERAGALGKSMVVPATLLK